MDRSNSCPILGKTNLKGAVSVGATALCLLCAVLLATAAFAAGSGERGDLLLARNRQPAPTSREPFDHLRTGFALTGAHRSLRCESCHVRGIFKGTPRQCATCHSRASGIASTVKPANHMPTTADCGLCHTSAVWSIARFDHSTLGFGGTPHTCSQCHNGQTVRGKPANHIVTTASCDTCHSTRVWVPATFDHSAVSPGSCARCHNGITATGKPGNHILTTASCDVCHRTIAWVPASFDHRTVTPGSCATCHNGTTATGKPANHILTTASCDSCHSTTAWKPATFDHSAVSPGSCATCHNGTTATGKSSGHFVTTRSCDACHSTKSWLPILAYSHTSAFFPSGHRSSVTCNSCHTTNSEVINWRFPAYKPDCAGCHADDYRPGAHQNATVSQLRNCSGACHKPPGHHRTSDSSWD